MTEIQPSFAARLQAVQDRVSRACARAGRPAGEVNIVAVSKRHPAESVLQMAACGQVRFGENQVQEAARKIPQVAEQWQGEPPAWHLVGHLQRNKVKLAVGLFQSIDSVDSFRLMDALQREGERLGRKVSVLLQFNCSQEPQKGGFSLADVARVSEQAPHHDHLEIRGLMTVAQMAGDPEDARKDFASLRKVKDDLEGAWGISLAELSMGMSHDFEIAIEEGATLVRVGTALFGPRKN